MRSTPRQAGCPHPLRRPVLAALRRTRPLPPHTTRPLASAPEPAAAATAPIQARARPPGRGYSSATWSAGGGGVAFPAIAAAEAAISNPLLDDITMKGARGVLINITGGPDMTLFEVDEAANRIREEVDSEANIVFGSTFDDAMEGLLRVSVVATGIEAESVVSPRPLPSGLSTLTPKPTKIEEPTSQEVAPLAERPVAQVVTPEPIEAGVGAEFEPTDENEELEELLLEET